MMSKITTTGMIIQTATLPFPFTGPSVDEAKYRLNKARQNLASLLSTGNSYVYSFSTHNAATPIINNIKTTTITSVCQRSLILKWLSKYKNIFLFRQNTCCIFFWNFCGVFRSRTIYQIFRNVQATSELWVWMKIKTKQTKTNLSINSWWYKFMPSRSEQKLSHHIQLRIAPWHVSQVENFRQAKVLG